MEGSGYLVKNDRDRSAGAERCALATGANDRAQRRQRRMAASGKLMITKETVRVTQAID